MKESYARMWPPDREPYIPWPHIDLGLHGCRVLLNVPDSVELDGPPTCSCRHHGPAELDVMELVEVARRARARRKVQRLGIHRADP